MLQSTADEVRGTVSVADDLVAQARLRISAAAPELIEADQDDYPCGVCGALLLQTDATRTITGLAAAQWNQVLLVVNVGEHDLVLAHDSSGSIDINRIITGPSETDLTIPPNGNVMLWYDAGQPRWRVVGAHV